MLDDGERMLVNRGWVPFTGYRDRLPDVSLPDNGVLDHHRAASTSCPRPGSPAVARRPTRTRQWPKLTSFPTHEELETRARQKLARRILLLDPGHARIGDYVREWSPPGLAPERHFSYAIQWWGFAVVLLVLYFGLNFRKVS